MGVKGDKSGKPCGVGGRADHNEKRAGVDRAGRAIMHVAHRHRLQLARSVKGADFGAIFDRDRRVRDEAAGQIARHRGREHALHGG